MMRLWMLSYARRSPFAGPGTLSVAVHGVAIALAVVGTRPSALMPKDGLANRVYYIPPPDSPMRPAGGGEAVQYVTLAPGPGAGPGPEAVDARKPITMTEHSPRPGNEHVDTATAPTEAESTAPDSVFTILEVDTAVVRSASSAAPAYPLDLLEKHVEGFVVTRYVVDTTGFADTTSLAILNATDPGFERAVRDALPYMRFSPAKIGSQRVRQLVEQTFTFRIAAPVVAGVPKPA